LYHHSNFNAPGSDWSRNPHARNHMTEKLFRSFCYEAGLQIVESIPIRWVKAESIDCLSLLRRPEIARINRLRHQKII